MEEFIIDGRSFLHLFYNIKSYDDMLNWLEKNKNNNLISNITKYRIVDYSFMLYNNKDIVINDDIVNIYIDYYSNAGKYIMYEYFNKKFNKKKLSKPEFSRYITSKFLTPSIIYDMLDLIKNTYNTINMEDYELNPVEFFTKKLLDFILSKIK